MLAVYSHCSTFLEHRNYCIMLTLYDTGVRLSELIGLKLDDVFLDEWKIVVIGKGNKQREIPIGKTLRRELAAYIPRRNQVLRENGCLDSGYLFVTEKGKPLSGSHVYRKIVREAGIRANITGKQISPHAWRRQCGRDYILNGKGDAFSLQQIYGHSDIHTTVKYVILANKDVKALHRRSSPLDHLND